MLAKTRAKKIRDRFLKIDPNSADYCDDNPKNYVGKLESLDASIKAAFLNPTKGRSTILWQV